MDPAGSTERFERAPIGRWISAGSFLVWNGSPRLGGVVAWGQPTEDDVRRMFHLVDAYHRVAPGCDVVTDVSRVQALQASVFDVIIAAMRERIEMYRAIPRHAVVRARGMMAALTEGIFPVLSSGHAWRVFDDAKGASETDQKIESIARAVGFGSHAHFTTAFRRATRETPSQYRARANHGD